MRIFENKLLLSLSFALFMGLAFPPYGCTALSFVAFFPLLLLDQKLDHAPTRSEQNAIKRYIFLGFVAFVLFTTWWVKNAAWIGLAGGTAMNTIFMYLSWRLFRSIKKHYGNKLGYISLPIFWVGIEHIHLNYWEFDFPWLPLGNAFAAQHTWVQWYEYTGSLGGSLWIWLVNLSLFWLYIRFKTNTKNQNIIYTTGIICLVAMPIIFSEISYRNQNFAEKKAQKIEIVVLQPNLDPYLEKFEPAQFASQLNDFLHLAQTKITPNTELLILPETSIPSTVFLNEKNWQLDTLNAFLTKNPNLSILAGALVVQVYAANQTPPPSARNNGSEYYDVYNAALLLQNGKPMEIYKKSKLVIGVEKMPYYEQIAFLKHLIVNLGGTSGQLGTQKNRASFAFGRQNSRIAPIICYESIFGNYTADYVRAANANIFAIITNDGWWGDTPGYKQHFDYARLRAIECHRNIARSANTGISGFISTTGDALQTAGWNKKTALRQSLSLHNTQTFYVQFGDIIGLCAAISSLFFVLLRLIKPLITQKK